MCNVKKNNKKNCTFPNKKDNLNKNNPLKNKRLRNKIKYKIQ